MNAKVHLAPFYLIAATFIGLGDTLFLSYYHLLNQTPGCAIAGCETVLNSPYATPFGIISLSYLGLVYYAVMFGIAVWLAVKPEFTPARQAALAYATVGLLCSVYFELFQYFVIHALCMYCAISAVTTLLLFGIALWHWKTS